MAYFSKSETRVPKRGGLKPAGKRQESATFLQRSFFDVAVRFFVCCSTACTLKVSAAQLSENCSATSVFRLWHVAGVGFRGVGSEYFGDLVFANMGGGGCQIFFQRSLWRMGLGGVSGRL